MIGQKTRVLFALVAIAASSVVFSGCARVGDLVTGMVTLDPPLIENQIKSWLIENGTETASVDCPDSMVGKTGDTWLCTATDPWDFTLGIRVTLTSSDGYVEWEIAY